ncbi:hypothetical protein ACHAPJ_011824 [Fusarium lateritium]
MDKYIGDGLERRFATRNTREKKKLVIDLALESYLKEERKLKDTHQVKTMDSTFKKVAIAQIKTFLFAGHDTTSIHRHAATWGDDAHLFKPERFLYDNDSAVKRDAYVPFSRGPRNCIGQDLAMTESKIILALSVRQFDFKAAFDELDKLKDDGTGYPSDTSGPQTQFGDEAYQIQLGAAKPREGMPCRLSLRKNTT